MSSGNGSAYADIISQIQPYLPAFNQDNLDKLDYNYTQYRSPYFTYEGCDYFITNDVDSNYTCKLINGDSSSATAVAYNRTYTVTNPGASVPTSTPRPTVTPKPTATPIPTATSKPTVKPTATTTPKPTATNTPKPTATTKPTATAKPTATSKPTVKPTATTTPKPTATNTPKPTATTKPTATPVPTATSKPAVTATPSPTEAAPGYVLIGEDDETLTDTPTAKPTATTKPSTTDKPAPTEPAANKPTPTSKPTATPVAQKDSMTLIREFVGRIYEFVLDREPEQEGVDYWTDELYYFRRSGAEVAQGFIFSDEFINRRTTDQQFVTILYKTFFGREPDEAGMDYWLGQLNSGSMDRMAVANGFIYSREWAVTCAEYKIGSGVDGAEVDIEPSDDVIGFVRGMYTTALARSAEEEGVNYWSCELSSFKITGERLGISFFMSDEFRASGVSDREFVLRLYRTFMEREPDDSGASYWIDALKRMSREEVVYGFTRSPEFVDKCIRSRILPY